MQERAEDVLVVAAGASRAGCHLQAVTKPSEREDRLLVVEFDEVFENPVGQAGLGLSPFTAKDVPFLLGPLEHRARPLVVWCQRHHSRHPCSCVAGLGRHDGSGCGATATARSRPGPGLYTW